MNDRTVSPDTLTFIMLIILLIILGSINGKLGRIAEALEKATVVAEDKPIGE